MKYDIFISHSSDDKYTLIDPLIPYLERLSITYWLDQLEIGWGDSIIQKINSGFSSSRYILVFLSNSFLDKSWTKLELDTALATEIDTKSIILLPVFCTERDLVFAKYPLLRSKRHLVHPKNPEILAKEIFRSLDRKFKLTWTHNHEKEYSGEVYIKIQKNPMLLDKKYRVTVNWGAWKRLISLPKGNKNSFTLMHTKGQDNTSIPIFVESNYPCYIVFGTGQSQADIIIDINKWWIPVNFG